MIDREKAIKWLEEISDYFYTVYRYSKDREEIDKAKDGCDAVEDAIALLKDQKPLSVVYQENPFTGLPVAHCPRCGKCADQFHAGQYGEETHFCPYCGQAVKWE